MFTQGTYTARVSEDSSVNDEVITVTATDRDENDVLTYSIASGGKSVCIY